MGRFVRCTINEMLIHFANPNKGTVANSEDYDNGEEEEEDEMQVQEEEEHEGACAKGDGSMMWRIG